MEDQVSVEVINPNTYNFKLTVLKNDILDISINSSTTTSKWLNIIAVSTFGTLIVIGLFGKNFIEIYNMIFK